MLVKKSSRVYTMVEGTLYKRSFSTMMLRCLGKAKANYTFLEVHERIVGQHLGARAVAKKIMRAWSYWMTMVQDTQDYMKRCDQCQRYSDVFNAPATKLHISTSSSSLMQWGMDILFPFAPSSGKFRYLIVTINYFTKLIEVDALVNITVENVIKLFKRNILVRFKVPKPLSQIMEHNL